MDNAGYTTLARQSGLMREMQVVANNIANMATGGFRKEGLIFSEYVQDLDGTAPSLSMATSNARMTSQMQGAVEQTGATFDLAIEGRGFFLIETPDGEALTRAGNFTPNAEGDLVTADGFRLLDAGGAPVFVPPDAEAISIAADGTLSADGQPLNQIGLWEPETVSDTTRRDGVLFTLDAPPVPVENGVVLQGFLEASNVNPVAEISRMIDVQRAYELGQGFLDKEDERIRGVLKTLGS
ncbi:flagellar basal-body rod protein FlgF [Palleronia aestuarii]|uniref:Flagellar basal-body rod protein FlgF n=1 Tax=Palleronia aestuarii TaxID=568105 RepID=A0A2W7NEA7_9RHOB|nr:flagellar hook-basal body complex protein [Palleronia aestuarii]PZX15074.1 flagellar basal-body rod protein FlgF [Palleronia aestuarii]